MTSWFRELWTSSSEEKAARAERAIVEHAVGSDETIAWSLRKTQLGGADERFISTVEFQKTGQKRQRDPSGGDVPIVLVHGLFASLGWYMKNYQPILEAFPKRRVLAFDWLGHGCSGRPDWPKRNLLNFEGVEATIASGDEFMVQAYEDWRIAEGIEKMDLVAHSTGGYFATLYALQYPHRVRKLVLVSPCGLLDRPPQTEGDDEAAITGFFPGLVDAAWSANWTPGSVIRMLGPLGESAVHSALNRRLGRALPDEQDISVLADYTFHTMAARGSSEYCMNSLLQPVFRSDQQGGVYARRSLQNQLASMKMPVTVMHGRRDWMFSPVWRDVAARLPNFELDFVDNAGHLLFIENAKGFNEKVTAALRRSGKGTRAAGL
jgi:cardiolipin-specific phospholipase